MIADQQGWGLAEVAAEVKAQDVEVSQIGTATLRQEVAKDRRISIEDAQMHHGRKSRSVRVDGYKRHILHDLDSGLVRAAGITSANVPEASVTAAIQADLLAQQRSWPNCILIELTSVARWCASGPLIWRSIAKPGRCVMAPAFSRRPLNWIGSSSASAARSAAL